MTYQQTIDWLFKQLPMYQRQGSSAYKANLNNTYLLDSYLNHPHQNFKSIHVAGTNGKGSVSHMLASIFQEAGYNVGLYTSPHLKDFRERIRVNGEMIPQQNVIQFVEKNRTFFIEHSLSFFEMTVGLAFQYFSEEKVDIAIIEVGLGGRLDSTNIITPELSIITNISLDHTQFLGNTLSAIAKEKAGIIKPNIPVIIGQTTNETKSVFKEVASNNTSKIYFAEDATFQSQSSDLKGDYQRFNIKTVLQAIEILKKDWHISKSHINRGLQNIIKNTGLLGRWQILQNNPLVVCDTAHNEEGLRIVTNQILSQKFTKLHIVLGVVNDKDLNTILPLFPKEAHYYFSKPNVPRGLDASILEKQAEKHHLIGTTYKSIQLALDAAKEKAQPTDLIFIGGSTFTVSEVV